MIKSIVIIAYIYGLLPLLIGTAVTLMAKSPVSPPQIYVSGYVIYLSLFEIMTVWGTHYHVSFALLTGHWKTIICILTILVLCCIGISIISIRKKHKSHKNPSLQFSRESFIILGLSILLILLAVLLLVPHPLDETPELAGMTLANDSFFSLDPSTGLPFTDSSSAPGCLHLFYAFGSTITGINATTLIHLVMPIVLLPLFVCIYLTIARILFPNEERSHDRFRFVWLTILFYLLMLPLEAHVAFAPYRNIWNGITLAASCFLPLFIAVCLDLTRHFSTGTPTPVFSIPNAIIGLIFLGAAVRLCVPYGFVLCSLFVLTDILIILVRVLWRNRSDFYSNPTTKGGEQV